MLPWSSIAPELKSLFSDLAFSGVPGLRQPFSAQWHDEQRSFTNVQVKTDLLLRVTSVRQPAGEDSRTFEMDTTPSGERLIEVLQGDRYITLNVHVESLDHSPELWAWMTIERIRTRLDRTTTHQRLRAINLGLVRVLTATALPKPRDGRAVSLATMDVLLVAGFRDVDTTGALSWIERIEVSGVANAGAGSAQVPPFTVAPFE